MFFDSLEQQVVSLLELSYWFFVQKKITNKVLTRLCNGRIEEEIYIRISFMLEKFLNVFTHIRRNFFSCSRELKLNCKLKTIVISNCFICPLQMINFVVEVHLDKF